MTHDNLIERAEKWLRNSLHCRIVLKELTAYTKSGETPDAIGFRLMETILIECKTSKADFYADRRKRSRNWLADKINPDLNLKRNPALGDWRFYFTPPGLLDGLELPVGWGWYEVHNKSVRHKEGPKYCNMSKKCPCTSHWQSERVMLLSALARTDKY